MLAIESGCHNVIKYIDFFLSHAVFWGFGAAGIAFALYCFPQWRHFNLFISVPLCLGLLIIFFFPPDSLPWLMANGRSDEARDFLSDQLAKHGNTSEVFGPLAYTKF